MTCQQLRNEIARLQREREDWQSQLRSASPGEKPFISRQIRRLGQDIRARQLQLDNCIESDENERATEVFINWTTQVTVKTNYPNQQNPYVHPDPVTLRLRFSPSRTRVWLDNFPDIVTPEYEFPIFGGRGTTTITQNSIGQGRFYPDSGAMNLEEVVFKIDHSINLPFIDSTLPLRLGTGMFDNFQGVPLDRATRQLVLVGGGIFKDGLLDGYRCTVMFDGSLASLP